MLRKRVTTAATPEEMRALGVRLGSVMQIGDVVALMGPLGTGKTTLSQGIAAGLQVPPERHVASPTFALVNEHPGRVPFVHADLYRLNDVEEMRELGLDEAYDRAAAVLEWADRFPDGLPADHLRITIEIADEGARRLTVEATGARAAALADALVGR